MIEVSQLDRRFGQVLALDNVSFQLESGEVVGFLGPNGAGKTTTMRILTGYLPATHAARLQVAGFDVLRQSLEVRKRIGYLPEGVPLYREMRVGEMMRFQGRLHRMDRQTLRRRIPEVLERVGVLDRQRQQVGELSRGLRQRVGLAVALLPEPEVLILDEPTSGLDPIQRVEVRALIRELASEHTVLLSSHILAEIESICPRVVILSEGRVVADGTKEELVSELGGDSQVVMEAALPDPEEACTLIASLPGVTRVELGERRGIHYDFRILGDGDLREDLGALAMQRGWALRELSWKRPSLEELFGKLVLGGVELSSTSGDAATHAGSAGIAEASKDRTPINQDSPVDGPGPDEGGLLQLSVSGAASTSTPLELSMEAPAETSPEASGDTSTGTSDPPLGTPGQKKVIYSLNPFDGGGSRDLSRPVNTETGKAVEDESGVGEGDGEGDGEEQQ